MNAASRASACVVAAAALVLGSLGCGSARRGEPFTGPVEVPLLELDSGRMVFMRQCNRCHPGGEAGLGPSLNEKPLPGFLMKFQVRHGLGAMPGFDESQISEAKLDQLIAYLKALRERPIVR